jgi:excisionase family DNA binding protein
MQETMTPEQVANYLQVATETVYRLIRANKLAATRVGRVYRIPWRDLETYITANSNRPAVREALFQRVFEVAERNPGVNSDDVLEELERMDAERKARMGA